MVNMETLLKETGSKVPVICESIVKQIESGMFLTETAFPSTMDIARKYGVSYVTAHKALSVLVDKGVLERRNGVGTFIREDAGVKIDRIGVPLRLESNPFFVSCYEMISKVAETFSVKAVFGDGMDELSMLDRFAADGIKAVIRFPGDPYREKAVWDKLLKLNMRTVVLNDWWLDGGPFPCVKTDEAQAAGLALNYLYSQGHKKIALIQDVFEENRFDLMKEFNRFHLEHGLMLSEENFMCFCGEKYLAVIDTLKQNKFTAVFSCFDYNTTRLLDKLSREGISVPSDVSVVSFDGTQSMEEKGITTIKQNIQELIREAFRIVLSKSYSDTKIRKVSAEIAVRKSVRAINTQEMIK
jgi:GntR family transcriptional regulator of arabinose operon